MMSWNWRRVRNAALLCIFWFYVGCGITLCFVKIDCTEAITKNFGVDPLVIREIIDREHLADKSPEFNKVEYAVLILSAPDNIVRRDTIRTTWMKLVNNLLVKNGQRTYKWNIFSNSSVGNSEFIKFFFVIGTKSMENDKISKLIAEAKKNKDLLLLEDLEESYKTLTEKMLQSLEWFSRYMKNLKYLIKCDDDSFVRVDLIVRELETFAPTMTAPDISEYVTFKINMEGVRGLYWGYFNGRATVYLKGKWKESEWFLSNNYLPYAVGGGYVISRSILSFIGRNNDLLSRYNSEDVSMGVWVSALRGINRVHDIRFDTEWRSRGCWNKQLIRHKQSTADMFLAYQRLVETNGEQLCTQQKPERKTYKYNWDVLPSNCCNVFV